MFNLCVEHILKNSGLDELQAGIKTGGRIINNLRYADTTTLMAKSEEELKSLLMKLKEKNERACLKLNLKQAMTNLDSVLNSKDIIVLTEVHRVKAMVFPVVTCDCESWTVKRLNPKGLITSNCGAGEDS